MAIAKGQYENLVIHDNVVIHVIIVVCGAHVVIMCLLGGLGWGVGGGGWYSPFSRT